MAITEKTEDTKIEIMGEHRIMRVHTVRTIMRDGEVITRVKSSRVLEPDMYPEQEKANVRRLANTVWTPRVKQAFVIAKRAKAAKPK